MKSEPVPAGTLFARLFSDIMIPPQFSAAIRAQGYDVAEVRTLPREIQRDDRTILAEAARQKRAVITCNYSDRGSNFCLIHEEWRGKNKAHFGIILIPQVQISNRLLRWEVRDRLLRFLNQRTAGELRNQLWWLPRE
jgi:predicted nuclease of predicted toxin-antitoxin system